MLKNIQNVATRCKTFAEKILHINEVYESKTLQLFYIALLASLTISFYSWNGGGLTYLEGESTCLPHIADCHSYKEIIPLVPQPYGYSENIFYVFLFALIISTAVLVYQQRFLLAHLILLILFAWKAYILFGITGLEVGNYDYYDMALGFVFLFSGNKLFMLRLTFVFLYFLSATVKIHDGWIVGSYFTSLSNGIPFFSNSSIPLVTNLITIFQIVGCWFLLFPKNTKLFKFFFLEFLLFHLYSGTIVAYRYIITSIPPLIILFAHPPAVPFRRGKSWIGYGFLVLLLLFQLIGTFIPGDQKLTLEGTRYGFYMFDANHQCIVYATSAGSFGTSTRSIVSTKSRYRCEMDTILQQQKKRCVAGVTVSLMVLHSINGGPFYRVVDEKDICHLTYRPFTRNEWIKSELEKPPIVGYPQKNTYQGYIRYNTTPGPLPHELIPTNIAHPTPQDITEMQTWIREHLSFLERFYWSIWIMTGFTVLWYLYRREVN